ncbi:MAG: oligopeptide transporter, OPT family [Candidatus Caenarcaniphilales bacterium]|nr:oligopeptide transporter, OPT family [Candidatus Caenarcaniphilales bacterium]
MKANSTPVKNNKEQKSTKELTLRSILLGILLSCLMAAANAYLGLKVGMTVSASIPAAVVSMYILKLLRNSNVLENNIVQTAASSGEALAAGAVFVLPSLILLGYWKDFPFIPTLSITAIGGIMGVLFTIPLRRVLIVETKLKFPEGIATAEVLKAGHTVKPKGNKDVKNILLAGLAAGTFKLCQSGFKLFSTCSQSSLTIGKSIFAFGLDLSPALLGVGYIVGLNIAILMFTGGIISWLIAIPLYSFINDIPLTNHFDTAMDIWSSKIRYLGVGAMVTGGIWALLPLSKAIFKGFTQQKKNKNNVQQSQIKETDKDISMNIVWIASLALAIPLFVVFSHVIDVDSLGISNDLYLKVVLFGVVFSLFAGFIFSSVAGYMAGLVGSSNNPISPATIASILIVCSVLLYLLGSQINFDIDINKTTTAAGTAILVGAIVCCAAAIAGDNMQDLKSGFLIGATPYKQQIMQIVGVLAGALAISPALSLLFNAYGLGGILPNPGMNPNDMLAAPQATIMSSLTIGAFSKNLEWEMIILGSLVAIFIILLDIFLKFKKSSFRIPVLAVAIGLYLPITLSTPIFIGGVISHLQSRNHSIFKNLQNKAQGQIQRSGIMFASGLITGEALVGILLAVPFVISGNTDILRLIPLNLGINGLESLLQVLGLLFFLIIGIKLYKIESYKRDDNGSKKFED